MGKPYSKPPLLFDQQLALMKSRGMAFPDEGIAMRALMSRRELLDAMEHVEIAMRASVTYHVAHECGAFAYADAVHFPGFDDHDDWLERVKTEIERSNEQFIAHFKTNYDGHLPLWMATEVMSLGGLSMLFKHLPSAVRGTIAKTFGVHKTVLENWFLLISVTRNKCAHHARIWNADLPVQPKIPNKDPKWLGLSSMSRLFVLLLILRHMLRAVGRGDNWARRVEKLIDPFAAKHSHHRAMGLTKDWTNHALWK